MLNMHQHFQQKFHSFKGFFCLYVCVYLFELLWFLNIFMRRIRNTIQMLTFFSVFWGYLFLYFRFTNQYKNIILSSSSMIKSTLLQVISFIFIDVNLNEHEKIASCK